MKEMEDAISSFVASDYSIYRAYHVIEDTQNTISKKIKDAEKAIADAKKRVKSGDMTKKEFDKLKTEKDTAITTLRKERDEIDKALETSYRQAIDKIKK
jgi:predicted  nucleic acid-binding Zn-ribbon protein